MSFKLRIFAQKNKNIRLKNSGSGWQMRSNLQTLKQEKMDSHKKAEPKPP